MKTKKKNKSYIRSAEPVYDWFDLEQAIQAKHNVNLDDYATKGTDIESSISFNIKHRSQWEDLYYSHDPEKDREPIGRVAFEKMNKAYELDPEGKAKEIPYWSWWHFVTDKYDNISNGSAIHVNFIYLEETATEDWQREICQLFMDEVDEDSILCMFSW